jgi:hypothetical protein
MCRKASHFFRAKRCWALAHDCRAKAQSFRNVKPRDQMLQLAAEHERKAARAEHAEACLRRTGYYSDDVPLAPK